MFISISSSKPWRTPLGHRRESFPSGQEASVRVDFNMKQILQDLSSGATELVDAPAPAVRRGQVLIDTSVSLISAGTERMLVDFGRSGLIAKARQQPEKVAQVLDKVRTDGLLTTLGAVRSKLGQPIPLGYC